MIAAYIFVTIFCGAFSLPFPRTISSSDNEFQFISKRSARLQPGNAYNFHHQVHDKDASLEDPVDPRMKIESVTWKDAFMPKKLSPLHCEPNCPAEYYADTSVKTNSAQQQDDDDILLHLSADKDLMKFLQWTMAHLGSLHSYNASDNYYPGMNMWTKLNLSGRRELPLYVEEPQYVVMRREPDDLEPQFNTHPGMPFIPPRGRKYIPDLENLKTRYELFVPNRGKKDKIKDIFKYDDLFFPNRGKKHTSNINRGEAGSGILGRYYYQLTEGDRKKLRQPFGDCFTRCNDITSAPAPPVVTTDQAENINGLVSAATLHLPPPLQIPSSALDAADADEHQNAVGCGAGAAGAVAECQKENNVKTNGFDQSVKAQIHQRQHSKGDASVVADSHPDHQQLSSSSSASVEAGASSFLPFIRPDQVRRLQPYPIRNKQWRDYYF